MRFAERQDYRVFRSGRLSGYVHRRFASEKFCRTLGDLFAAPPSLQKTLYTRYRNRETFRVKVPIDGCLQEEEMFLKSVRWRSYWHLLYISSLMPSVALRYLTIADALGAIGIDTPLIVAVGEEKNRFAAKQTFILTRSARNTTTLGQYLGATSGGPHSRSEFAERRRIIRCFAGMVRQLHRNKTFHMDLKPDNILLSRDGGDASSLVLVDLDNAAIARSRGKMLPEILRAIDFLILAGHFYPSTHLKERLRFLAAYRGQKPRGRRLRKVQFLLVSSPMLFRLYRFVHAMNLIQLVRRLFICLRVVR
jgi:tRNA A-37 threonylcarbamoyl transferase component Bud32